LDIYWKEVPTFQQQQNLDFEEILNHILNLLYFLLMYENKVNMFKNYKINIRQIINRLKGVPVESTNDLIDYLSVKCKIYSIKINLIK
jgi:hypothetical protein